MFHETPLKPKEYTVKNAFAGTPKIITPKILRTVGDARPYGLQTDKTKKHKTPAVFTAEGDILCIPIPFPKVTPQQA